jgi:hypothetical protein
MTQLIKRTEEINTHKTHLCDLLPLQLCLPYKIFYFAAWIKNLTEQSQNNVKFYCVKVFIPHFSM